MSESSPQKYLLKIAYDGTAYGGWQIQENAPSIQGIIENTLHKILQEKIPLVGSGRTDAGVHALGQTAHFSTAKSFVPAKLLHSLNQLLPPDIRILEIHSVPLDFHARYSAIRKVYEYHLHLTATRSPFLYPFSYHPPYKVDLLLLKQCLPFFVGTHDFTSFANEAHSGSAAKDPVRTLFALDLIEKEEGVSLRFKGEGFLYKMVRNITGTLLDIAAGKMDPSCIPTIFAAKDRRVAGRTAPAQGLFLVEVHYPKKTQAP